MEICDNASITTILSFWWRIDKCYLKCVGWPTDIWCEWIDYLFHLHCQSRFRDSLASATHFIWKDRLLSLLKRDYYEVWNVVFGKQAVSDRVVFGGALFAKVFWQAACTIVWRCAGFCASVCYGVYNSLELCSWLLLCK